MSQSGWPSAAVIYFTSFHSVNFVRTTQFSARKHGSDVESDDPCLGGKTGEIIELK